MKKILILLLLSPVMIMAQQSFTLEQAQQYALEHSRDVELSDLNIEKAKEVVKETIAIGLPQVNGSVEYNNFLDIPVTVLPDFISPSVYGVLLETGLLDPSQAPGEPGFVEAAFGTSNTANAGVSLNQLIFDGSYLVGLQSTRVFLNLSEYQKDVDLADLKNNVANAYYNVVIAKENVKTLTASKATLQTTFNEISALYQEGLTSEDDKDQMELTLTNLQNSINNAERQIELAKQLLKLNMGMDISTPITVTDEMDQLVNNDTEVLVKDFSVANVPEYKLLETNIKSKELLLKNQKVQYLPKLNGFFRYSQSAQRNEFNFFDFDEPWFPSTVWGLQLNVPIFSSGMKHRRVNQAKFDLEMAQIEMKSAEEGLALSAQRAKSDYDFAQDSYQNQKSALELAEKIRNKTLVKYKEGMSSSFELNQIESQYIEAQGNYLMSILNLLQSKEAYKRAYGL